MINAPLSQSLTSTRATLPVWNTSSQIESSPLSSPLWCNRTHFSQDTYPLFISSNKLLCVSWVQLQLPEWVWWFWGQHGYSSELFPCWGSNDQSLCATDLARFAALPCALAHHSAWHWAIIVRTNYMTRWEEYDCRSVPVVYQINKCLMTLSLPLFNLIRGEQICWMDDSTAADCESETGDCQPFIHCMYCFVQLLDCCPSHLTMADHQQAQLCGCSHLNILLQGEANKMIL